MSSAYLRLLIILPAILIPACFSSSLWWWNVLWHHVLAWFQMYSVYKLNKQVDNIQSWYSFPYLKPVYFSMSSSKCCFLTCLQISQEAGQVVWNSYLFKNFPQFVVIHTVKGFGLVNKTEVDVFLELCCFSMMQQMLEIWSFSKSSLNIWKFTVQVLLKLAWRILSIALLECEMSAIV